MDQIEARSVLLRHFAGWRGRSYRELIGLLGNQGSDEVLGPSGAAYQIEVEVLWEGKPKGPVRVVGSIDDGKPITSTSGSRALSVGTWKRSSR
ncbi:MAG: hypothetical protein U0792_05335 [Gemmataceae bacterium]